MWASIMTIIAELIKAGVAIWGPPSEDDLDKLAAAIQLLPVPGPAEAALEYIRTKAPK
jgi:hypothetical protein